MKATQIIKFLETQSEATNATGISVIFDVFRASNTILSLFSRGFTSVYACKEIETAKELSKSFPDALLIGERKGLRLSGFHMGNSPVEVLNLSDSSMNSHKKQAIITTSAGTKGILEASKNAHKVIIGSFANMTILYRYLKQQKEISLVAIGLEAKERAEEDYQAALLLQNLLLGKPILLDDIFKKIGFCNGTERLLRLSQTQDLEFCTKLDCCPLLCEVTHTELHWAKLESLS
jgi:2-phosphosulfolactate phosphatase